MHAHTKYHTLILHALMQLKFSHKDHGNTHKLKNQHQPGKKKGYNFV